MTPVFWVLLVILALLAILFILVPVLRFKASAFSSPLELRKQLNRDVFEQRQLELEAEAADGLVSADEIQRMRSELQRSFMRDMEALEQDKSATPSSSKLLPYAFILLLPIASVLLYQKWGSAPDLSLPTLFEKISAAEDADTRLELLDELTQVLQERLERREDDLRNAYMLGTLYKDLQRNDEAEATFRHMLEQMEESPDKATVYGQLATVLYQASEITMTEGVQSAIDSALALDSNEFNSVGILANDAFLREDLPAALGYWRRQLSSAIPGSQDATSLRQVITLVESYLPEEEQANSTQAVAGATITITVDISPALIEQLDGKQSLFVYVRNPDIRPPLLAQNLSIPEFPFTITLDNSMSMTGMTLETAPTLIVGARVSATGNAIAQSGDLQTVTDPFVLDELQGPVNLLIDQLVP